MFILFFIKRSFKPPFVLFCRIRGRVARAKIRANHWRHYLSAHYIIIDDARIGLISQRKTYNFYKNVFTPWQKHYRVDVHNAEVCIFCKKILLANSHHYPLIGLPTRDTIICRSNLFGRNTALYHTHGISNANPILLCILFIERSEHKRRPTQNTMTTKRLIFNTKKMIGLGWNGDDASSRYYSKVLFAKENQRIV